jgi:hypothetical protein
VEVAAVRAAIAEKNTVAVQAAAEKKAIVLAERKADAVKVSCHERFNQREPCSK